jgi:hypothetical protein
LRWKQPNPQKCFSHIYVTIFNKHLDRFVEAVIKASIPIESKRSSSASGLGLSFNQKQPVSQGCTINYPSAEHKSDFVARWRVVFRPVAMLPHTRFKLLCAMPIYKKAFAVKIQNPNSGTLCRA